RFDRQVLVPSPDEKSRLEILRIHTKKMPLKGVELKAIAKETEWYSGADLEALVREAGLNALRKDFKAKSVTRKDFEDALKRVRPSVTPELIKFYSKIAERIKAPPVEKATREKMDYVG
ncbi:MAG TPA: AAA family ATPase, partial [archaeon]|nr:AAA family ATPase [archaeon]